MQLQQAAPEPSEEQGNTYSSHGASFQPSSDAENCSRVQPIRRAAQTHSAGDMPGRRSGQREARDAASAGPLWATRVPMSPRRRPPLCSANGSRER